MGHENAYVVSVSVAFFHGRTSQSPGTNYAAAIELRPIPPSWVLMFAADPRTMFNHWKTI